MKPEYFTLANLASVLRRDGAPERRRRGVMNPMLWIQRLAVAACLFCGAEQSARGTVLADSANDFCNVQGANGWYYGYYQNDTLGNFSQNSSFTANAFSLGDAWTRAGNLPAVWRDSQHPNNSTPAYAVRRWVSTFNGPVVISGKWGDLNAGGGNGVICSIRTNGVAIASYDFANGGAIVDYSVTVTVAASEAVDFVVDPKGGYDFDLTKFTVVIEAPGASTTLTIQGQPAACGTVTPAYGTTSVNQGDSFTCSASVTGATLAALYACAGYVLGSRSEDGSSWVNPVTNAATSFTYTQGTTDGRVIWLWTPIAYALAVQNDGGHETFSFSANPDTNGYYTAGTSVALTANGATSPASTFVRWTGDVPAGHETDNPLTITMDAPKMLTAHFSREWVYTPGNSATISDGDWTLNVTGTTELTITSVATSGTRGLIDLTTPISNGGTVTALGNYCFSANAVLKDIRLPEGITSIGLGAFYNSVALTNVTPLLPGSLVSLGDGAFKNCTSLAGDLFITNSAPVTIAGSDNFNGTKIVSATLGSGVTNLSSYMLSSCSQLRSVTLPETLVSIGLGAFFNSTALTNVTPLLSGSLVSLGDGAFKNCTSLTGDLFITNTAPVTIAGRDNFNGTKIASVTLGVGVTNLSSYMFTSCPKLGSVSLSDDVTIIGYGAFRDCASLTNITPLLPKAVSQIGGLAFLNSPIEGDLSLGNITTLSWNGQDSQFANTKIAVALLGKGVTNLPVNVFYGCTEMKQVWFCGDRPSFGSGFLGVGTPTNYQVRCYVPRGKATWDTFAAENVSPLSTAERTSFQQTYPGERLPIGTWITIGGQKQWYSLWTPPGSEPLTTMILVR